MSTTTPTVPAAPAHPTIGRGLAAKPDTFNGDKAKYKAWWRSVNLYLNDPFNGIIDEGHKINTVISLIRGPDVDTWVENYYNDNYNEGTGKWNSTWAALITELKSRFVDANAEKLAQMKLENLQQGKDTAEDFFQQFEGLIKKAGYDKKQTYLITLLERNVHASIIDTIYRGTALPADYDAWKDSIIKIDNLWRRRQYNRQQRPTPAVQHPKPAAPTQQQNFVPRQNAPAQYYAPPAQTAPAPTQAPAYQPRRDGTGVTYAGGGQPMDLDRKCFKCRAGKNEKGTCGSPWHVPNRQPHTRQMEVPNWSQPDQQEAFAEMVRQWAATDPEGFKAKGFGVGTA